MKKTFTIHDITRKEISPGKGSMVWFLTDEKGLPRKVNAITDVDKDGVVHGVNAVYSRETPLVTTLMYRDVGDEFSIDFSSFNNSHHYTPRKPYKPHHLDRPKLIQPKHIWSILWLGVFILLGVVLYLISQDFTNMHVFSEGFLSKLK